MGKISFFSEDVAMPVLDYGKAERWIESVVASHGKSAGDLTYCFCSDLHILKVNREFLDHDYFTDIITFDYSRGKTGLRRYGDLARHCEVEF